MYENIRIFTAIPLPEPARQAFSAKLSVWKEQFAFGRWVYPNDWHLTLHFIGDVQQSALPRVAEAMTEAAERQPKAFKLVINGLGTFGQPDQPRVLWLGLEAVPGELRTLHDNLGRALSDKLGYRPEKRPYSPHITLARKYAGSVSFETVRPVLEALSRDLADDPIELTVDGFVAYRTRMGRVPMYEEIIKAPFKQSPE